MAAACSEAFNFSENHAPFVRQWTILISEHNTPQMQCPLKYREGAEMNDEGSGAQMA